MPTPTLPTFSDTLSTYKALLASADPSRKKAMLLLEKQGFPHRKVESFKYMPLDLFLGKDFHFAKKIATPKTPGLFAKQKNRLVFVNGNYQASLSELSSEMKKMMAGVKTLKVWGPLRSESLDSFSLLNQALRQDGGSISIPANTSIKEAIHLIFLTQGNEEHTMNQIKNSITLGKNAQATILLSFVGENKNTYWNNTVTNIHLSENARLNFYVVQDEGPNALHLHTTNISQDSNSFVQTLSISSQGKAIRNNLNVTLSGPGSECQLLGIYMCNERQYIDNHTFIDHAAPHCTSFENYKGILDEQAEAVFDGSVLVAKDAQKTNAAQHNKNLLLSDKATVHTKPGLKILADDVICTHGSTVGQLDQEMLFYLQSRGLGKEQARELLMEAFIQEVLDQIADESIRESLQKTVAKKLHSSSRK